MRGSVNIGSGEGATVRSIVEQLAEAAGRPDAGAGRRSPAGPGDPDEITAVVTRLRDEIGFRPRHSLADGLRGTVEWWREQAGDRSSA